MVDQPESITVVGGGLAGLSAVTELVNRGYEGELTLLERSPFLGGRASTLDYGSRRLDIGQHMHVSGFKFYLDFLKKIGLEDEIRTQRRLEAEFRDGSGLRGKVEGSDVPPPFHLARSMIKFPFISFGDKLSLAGPLLSALLFDYGEENGRISFGDWLRRRGATKRSIERLWNQIVVPTLNARVKEVSVPMGMMILKRVLLDRSGGKLGRLDCHLSEIGTKTAELLEKQGGTVELLSPAVRIEPDGEGKVGVELKDGERIESEVVLSAVPGHKLVELLPDNILDRFSQPFWDLEWNSIINVHLFFSGPVMEREFFGFLEGTAGWVFNVDWNDPSSGKHVCLTLSDPGELEDLTGEELVELVKRELSAPLPKIKETSLTDSVVLRQPRATFKPLPGSRDRRPPQDPGIPGLFLAGDWTDTGWPATMEGAVRSGYYAVDEILGSNN